MIPPSAAADRRSFPATGCSISKTWSTPTMCPVLHGSFSGPQFTNMMASMPEVKFETLAARRHRALDPASGRRQGVLPGDGSRRPHAARGAQSARRAVRPRRIDRLDAADRRYSFRIYVAGRVKNSGDIGRMRSKFNGKFWWDMTEQEHQQFPGDYEAQVGQGAGDAAFGRALRPERPRHPDDPADAERSARGDGRGPRSDRGLLELKRAAG